LASLRRYLTVNVCMMKYMRAGPNAHSQVRRSHTYTSMTYIK